MAVSCLTQMRIDAFQKNLKKEETKLSKTEEKALALEELARTAKCDLRIGPKCKRQGLEIIVRDSGVIGTSDVLVRMNYVTKIKYNGEVVLYIRKPLVQNDDYSGYHHVCNVITYKPGVWEQKLKKLSANK